MDQREFSRRGGKVKSAAKTAAARINTKRPRFSKLAMLAYLGKRVEILSGYLAEKQPEAQSQYIKGRLDEAEYIAMRVIDGSVKECFLADGKGALAPHPIDKVLASLKKRKDDLPKVNLSELSK